jgi:hypothetical protein
MKRYTLIVVISLILIGSVVTYKLENHRPENHVDKDFLVEDLYKELESHFPDIMTQALALNAWIYISIGTKGTEHENLSGEETLQLLDGSCGFRSLLVREIFERLKIPVRRVNFYNIPVQMGHSNPELYIDGEWRFIDPYFGIFFSEPINPYLPISIKKARALYPDILIMRVQMPGWQGVWTPVVDIANALKAGTLYHTVSAGWIKHPHDKTRLVADTVQSYFASTMSQSEVDDIIKHPTYIDLRKLHHGQIGVDDHSYQELLSPFQQFSYGNVYQPFGYILGSYKSNLGPNIIKQFSFLADDEKWIQLKIKFVKQVDRNERKYFLSQIDHAVVDFTADSYKLDHIWAGRSLTIFGKIKPPVTTIELSIAKNFATTHQFYIDVIKWATVENGNKQIGFEAEKS